MDAHAPQPQPRRQRRARLHVGRRGASLLFLGLVALIFAYGLTALPGDLARSPSYRFVDSVMPLRVWAALWAGVGALCVAQTFMDRDRLAFGLAEGLLAAWGGTYILGWALHDVPRGYVLGSLFLAFAAWVFIISGWPEVPTRPPPSTPPGPPEPPEPPRGRPWTMR